MYESYSFQTDTFALTIHHNNTTAKKSDGSPAINEWCDGRVRRVISLPHFKRGLDDGYYASIGGYARGRSDLQSQLSRKSDEVSERLGIDHDFKVADDPTPEFFGVTEEGLDNTARKRVASGAQEVKKFY